MPKTSINGIGKLMNKVLKKKRTLLDYIPSNIYFYYHFLAPVINCAKNSQKTNTSYDNILENSRLVNEACLKTGVKIHLQGLENIQTPQARVIVANHMSSLETLTLPFILKGIGKISFVIKQELLDKKFFGHIMKTMRCIPMTRSNPKRDLKTLFKQGETLLKEGYSIVIFPQKTRSINFNPKEFNSIGCKLAVRQNVAIQALALKTDFMLSSSLIKDFGKISRQNDIFFKFSNLMKIDRNNQQDIHQKIINFISQSLENF